MIVKLTGEFATLTGKKEVEIYGPTNIKQLLKALDSAYPNVLMETKQGWENSNVVINGVMYSDSWFQPIVEGDEVVIMPPIEGG